jgi:hypothetical protein
MSNSSGKLLKVYAPGGKVVGAIRSTGDTVKDIALAHDVLVRAGYPTKVLTKAQRMRKQARSFARVAFDVFEIMGILGQKSADYLAPFAVNAAFSIELYLKAIGIQNGIRLRGHKLLKLYDALPPGARDAVDRVAPDFVSRHNLEEPPDIRKFLTALNDAFTTWRYSYESQTGLLTPRQALFLLHVLDRANFRQQESVRDIHAK